MLDREVTPLDEASSCERTTSFLEEEKSSEDTPLASPHNAVVLVVPAQPIHRSTNRKLTQIFFLQQTHIYTYT